MSIGTESCLSSKITICEYIESVNEKQVLDLLEWMKEELGCGSLNHLLIKILMDSSELLTNDALINIVNKTKCMNMNNKIRKSNKTRKTIINNNNNNNTFPLLRLPNDIITSSLLYLNQNLLMRLERCNRMLYKMINNSTFLKKCRNFKKFRLTDKILDQIVVERIDCYKFSFANEFVFDFESVADSINDDEHGRDDILENWANRTSEYFKRMLYYGSGSYNYHSNWLADMFPRIKSIYFDQDAMLLIDLFPVELLFDKDKSQLKNLHINDCWQKAISDPINRFKEKFLYYLSTLQSSPDDENDEINVLDTLSVEGVGYFSSFEQDAIYRMLPTSHLIVDGFSFDCTYLKNNANFVSQLKRLTLSGCEMFVPDDVTINNNKNNTTNDNNNVSIDTLRLLDIADASMNLVDKSLITMMNFESSLKNLTLQILFPFANDDSNYVESVIRKEYLFNLENVNILFAPWNRAPTSLIEQVIDELFDVLRDNVKLLQHQFKQLNLGMHRHVLRGGEANKIHAYRCFSWNPSIDVAFINQQKNEWKSLLHIDDDYTKNDEQSNMYEQFEQQWI